MSGQNDINISGANQLEQGYWYDGQLIISPMVTLPCQDPGLLFGATVFTTLRVYEHDLDHPWTMWKAHMQRAARSLQEFHWSEPDWLRIRQGAEALAPHYPVLRVTLFPDGRELIVGRSLPSDLAHWQTEGVTAWVAAGENYHRSQPAHKTGNYLGSWLSLQAAQRAQAQVAILINEQGHWLETSTGNLWGWAQGQWYTPPLATGILPGVMRSRVIQGLQSHHQPFHIVPWRADLIAQFTYLAHTNSVLAVVPIRTVLQGKTSVNYNPDQGKTEQLTKAWQAMLRES